MVGRHRHSNGRAVYPKRQHGASADSYGTGASVEDRLSSRSRSLLKRKEKPTRQRMIPETGGVAFPAAPILQHLLNNHFSHCAPPSLFVGRSYANAGMDERSEVGE